MIKSPARQRSQPEPMRRRVILFTILALLAATSLAIVAYLASPKKSTQPLDLLARRALARGDFVAAEQLATEAAEGGDADILLVAAEAALRRNRSEAALDYYARVDGDDVRRGYENLILAGQALSQGGRLREAERKFKAALLCRPDDLTPHNKLALLHLTTGRRREAAPHLLEAVKKGAHTVHTLCLLAQSDGANFLPLQYRELAEEENVDPLVLLALATHEIHVSDWQSARRHLQRALERMPELVEAEVQLGRVLWESGDMSAFERWATNLSQAATNHPLAWRLQGLWAEQVGSADVALRCYGEALRIDADDLPANYRMGQLLKSKGDSGHAAPFLERAAEVERLSTVAGILYQSPQNVEKMREAAESCERLGRIWESWGWARVAAQFNSQIAWPIDHMRRLEPTLTNDLPQIASSDQPISRLDLSAWPLPQIGRVAAESDTTITPASSPIQFSDDANTVGLIFTYFNGAESGLGHKMHEFTGGGVGVIDFDLDSRPDLFLTQGCVFPPRENSGPSDMLYRNLGESFGDVSQQSKAIESTSGFGQGVATGDFDGDGFGDLYIANIGRNRLLQNNGDGTFSDVTSMAQLPDLPLVEAWTTSVAMADVTGDGLPDLFDANYVTAPDVYDRICSGADGRPQSCPPTEFDGSPDRLLVNLGNGNFEDQSANLGITGSNGNGLGVVVAELNGDNRLDLFVANDQTANHFYESTLSENELASFDENALAAGLAFDQNGRSQACMGVAAGDANGDGRLDLFVTNFYLESNTLYSQLPSNGLFEDRTTRVGLREPSLKMLGFGTQFIDADLDGWPDLIVANGHIDDFSSIGTPHRMKPQFFRNRDGEFTEVEAARIGPYFEADHLGRSLARLDWNDDGRDDCVISNLDTPVALLTNQSDSGNALKIRLVATTTSRDAIGAIVSVDAGTKTTIQQMTAGDGYQASNERNLTFGVGDAAVANVTVRWPSGNVESFDHLTINHEWLIVEGRRKATVLGETRQRD